MTQNGLDSRSALLLALAPAALLILGLMLADHLAPGPGLATLTALVGGAIWFLAKSRTRKPMAVPTTPARDALTPSQTLEPLPDPVLLLNRDRHVVSANRAARDLMGIGGTGGHLARSLRHPAVLAAVDTVCSGVPSISEEITLPVPVPRTFTLHTALLPKVADPDQPTVAIVLHDETRARRAEQSRADFVANASHELRSPLSVLIGFIETLRGPAREDPDARDKFLEVMRTEAQRMARLIEDLLSLSRVEINEHVPPRDLIDLSALLHRVAESLQGRALEKGMNIRISCPTGLPALSGDRDQLIQVFHNLIDNAVKYGRADTTIEVTVRRLDRLPGTSVPAVAVAVSDQSDGIAAVHLPRITERFYRVDDGRSRKMGGTGLGLAIVKHIVNRHRGQLKIESTIGDGSRFTVMLPAHPPEPIEPQEFAAASTEGR